MSTLFIVGGGLFGSLAAACARSRGIESVVFDSALDGAASHAAAGLFAENWIGKKLREHYQRALPLLERLYEIRPVSFRHDDCHGETFLCVPPASILEPAPVRERVTAVGDGWLEAGGRRYQGWVYVAAGVWCEQFLLGLGVYGKAGASFDFPGEQEARIRRLDSHHQAIAFVRDSGTTFFSDGTAEREYTPEHDRHTLERAAAMGLTSEPVRRRWGRRPYTPGGPVFRKIASRTWLATGGRKTGTILGASFARQLVEQELGK